MCFNPYGNATMVYFTDSHRHQPGGPFWMFLFNSLRPSDAYMCQKTIIGSGNTDNGLSPDRRQAIIFTNAHLLSIRPIGTKFIEMLI